MYDLGKERLLFGTKVQPAYAPVCAEKGLVTLAIDSWCFGERKSEPEGGVGELLRSAKLSDMTPSPPAPRPLWGRGRSRWAGSGVPLLGRTQ